MSSKLVRRDTVAETQPMPWQQMHTAGPIPSMLFQPMAPPPSANEVSPDLLRLQGKVAELEHKVREARDTGRKEGESAGRQSAHAEVQAVLQKLGLAIQETVDLRPRLRREAEADLVRLAVSIARRILHRELNTDPEAIGGLVKVGLEKLRMQEVTRVTVHPDHQAALKELLQHQGVAHVELAADPAQDRGAVVFQTNRGSLDLSLETQLREIERGLTDRFKGQGV
jgi:flagellar assembly protein FliH